MRVLGSARSRPPSVMSIVTPAPSPVLAPFLPHGQMALQVFRLIPWRREERVRPFLTKKAGCLQALVFLAPLNPHSRNPPRPSVPEASSPGITPPSVSLADTGGPGPSVKEKTPFVRNGWKERRSPGERGTVGGSKGCVFIWDLNPIYFREACWWRPPGPALLSYNTHWTGMRSSSSQMMLSWL